MLAHRVNHGESLVGEWKVQVGQKRVEFVGLYLFDRLIHTGDRGHVKAVFDQDTGQRQPNTSFIVHEQYALTKVISHGSPLASTQRESTGWVASEFSLQTNISS
jgi:hypothetical protein